MLGQSLQTDPVGYDDDFNLYTYVRNDPANNSDPEGRQAVLIYPPPPLVTGPQEPTGWGPTLEEIGEAAVDLLGALAQTTITTTLIQTPGLVTVLNSDATRPLGELETIDAPAHNEPRPELQGLTDEQLSDAVNNPANGDRVTVRGNRVLDGNGRVNEMRSRGFSDDTRIPVDELPEEEDIAPWESDG